MSEFRMSEFAERIRHEFVDRSFGAIHLWTVAALRPHDNRFLVVSVHSEGDRLDLVLVHASRRGLASVLSVWSPESLRIDDQGLQIQVARKVAYGAVSGESEGADVHFVTARGAATVSVGGAAALSLT